MLFYDVSFHFYRFHRASIGTAASRHHLIYRLPIYVSLMLFFKLIQAAHGVPPLRLRQNPAVKKKKKKPINGFGGEAPSKAGTLPSCRPRARVAQGAVSTRSSAPWRLAQRTVKRSSAAANILDTSSGARARRETARFRSLGLLNVGRFLRRHYVSRRMGRRLVSASLSRATCFFFVSCFAALMTTVLADKRERGAKEDNAP